jgi:hypothetical protein
MAQDVLCEVDNCTYWGSGNKCNADAIYVVSHKGKQASKHLNQKFNFFKG